jgi:phosphatidylserine/phosphatidylglycerophosphate/cardiolipin synthase-like enzyme
MPDLRGTPNSSVLVPGSTCWRLVPSRRFSLLIDARDYYAALAEVLETAERQILIAGWDFDSSIHLRPEIVGGPMLGETLRRLVEVKPDLHVRLLIWRGSIFYGDSAEFPPLFGANWRDHERIHFVYDDCHPLGGSHHQKAVCIDDNLAFVGGIDLTRKRWDDPDHSPDRCRRFGGDDYDPVHDVQTVFDGQAAQAIAEMFRERWHCNTGEVLPELPLRRSPWPASVRPTVRDTKLGVLRTLPAYAERSEAREIERFNLAALETARRTIYIEAQYFALPEIAEILAEKLAQAAGPEIVIIANRRSTGMIEQYVMAQKRDFLFARLRRADREGRLRLYYPVGIDASEYEIHVHSKLLIVDDTCLRVGSSNLNGRSMGLDSECDIVLEAETDAARRAIGRYRCRLIAEHLGIPTARLTAMLATTKSLVRALDRLNHGPRRLRPYVEEAVPESVPFGESLLDPPRPLDFEYLWKTLLGSKNEPRAS